MPRSRKTMTGTPAQPVEAISGQQYGRGVEQEAMQRVMPTPAEPAVTVPRTPAQPAQETQAQAPTPVQRQRMTPEQAMQMVAGMGGVLSAPDDNPAIPITDGLSTGPGRGPEVLRNQSTLGDTLRRLSLQTNDPVFLRLASKVNI